MTSEEDIDTLDAEVDPVAIAEQAAAEEADRRREEEAWAELADLERLKRAVRNRPPRTKAEHELKRIAVERRDLREQRRLLERHHAAVEQARTIEPDNPKLIDSRDLLEGRLARVKRRHAELSRQGSALAERLVKSRASRRVWTPVPHYDLRIRRPRKGHDSVGDVIVT